MRFLFAYLKHTVVQTLRSGVVGRRRDEEQTKKSSNMRSTRKTVHKKKDEHKPQNARRKK